MKYAHWNTPELWKTWEFDDILLQHCNAVYNQNTIDRWTEGCVVPFPRKGDQGIAKNYWGITLTSIPIKIYNALLHNHMEPKIEKILRKNQNGFRRNRSTMSQIFTRMCSYKKPQGNNIIRQLLRGIWRHTQKEDGANTYRLRPPHWNYLKRVWICNLLKILFSFFTFS